MGFSEKVKREVKEKAMFRCCICQVIRVHIHHILPTKDGGSDDIDNAAPLCPSCHDNYGDNPSKRKEIKQMRDFWYKKVEKMYPDNSIIIGMIENIDTRLETIQDNFANQNHSWRSELNELKDYLKGISENNISKLNLDVAPIITPEITKTFSLIELGSPALPVSSSSLIELGSPALPVSSMKVSCPQCNNFFDGYLNALNFCPNCHHSFNYPEELTYVDYGSHLLKISDQSLTNLSLDVAPAVATGIIDVASNLDNIKFYGSGQIFCPKCNRLFADDGSSPDHVCPFCNHNFTSLKLF